MVQTYNIAGLSCSSCEAKVKSAIKTLNDVEDVSVSAKDQLVAIRLTQPVRMDEIQKVLDEKYTLSAINSLAKNSFCKTNFWASTEIWKKASFNTLNCLIGCSLGDFGMLIFLQYFYPNTPMATQMILAVVAGLTSSVALESSLLRFRENMIWKDAFTMAIGMSFISMVAMEIAMNATDFMLTGGRLALTDPAYWLAFIPSAVMGFLIPLPYNYYRLKKYKKACH
jgi:cation transport ATPase